MLHLREPSPFCSASRSHPIHQRAGVRPDSQGPTTPGAKVLSLPLGEAVDTRHTPSYRLCWKLVRGQICSPGRLCFTGRRHLGRELEEVAWEGVSTRLGRLLGSRGVRARQRCYYYDRLLPQQARQGGGTVSLRTKAAASEAWHTEPGPSRIATSGDELYRSLAQISAFLYKESLTILPPDVRAAIDRAQGRESSPGARLRLKVMQDAVATSDRTGAIVCQDTGIPVYFLRLGTAFPIDGARLEQALSDGIEAATTRYSLRSSVVHPITRENPQTNTGRGVPIFHVEFVDGADWIDLLLVPKGSGSENMSFLAMLNPAEGVAGVKRFVLDSVMRAGARPCPPTIVGVGLGGTADECVALAKLAITRPVGEPHPEADIAALELQLCEALNATGIGPQGLGGSTTAFAVHIEYAYTHISMNPVAVNIQCWRGERARALVHSSGEVEYGF